ncbi:MAG: hypothetical protein EXS08_11985 [Planctomycetes bacterium]|nr:hypothetical protein [Planctomycetota bacterium]
MDARLSLWVTLAFAAPLSAQSYRLNTPFPPGPTVGDAFGPEISADGAYVVYSADQERDDVFELFSVRADGSAAPVKLVSHGEPDDYEISPDGQWVVYRKSQLYSVPIQGGASPVRLSSFGVVQTFEFSPSTQRVLFIAQASGFSELYSAPVDGSSPAIKLSHPLPSGVDVEGLRISPDGLHALYLARKANVEAELRCVPVDGSAGAVLVQRLTAPADIQTYYYTASHFDFGPDGARVVFRADKDTDEVFELYSAPRDGSAPAIKISGTLAASEDVLDYGFGQTGGRVVYRTQPGPGERLRSAPIDGSAAPIELTTSAHQAAYEFRVDPAGTRVVFQAYGPSAIELFTVPIDGSTAALQISNSLPGLIGPEAFAITPDGSRVVYAAPEDVSTIDLYSVPIDGSPGRLKLSGPGGGVQLYPIDRCFSLSADGAQIVYRADPELDSVFHLFSAPLDGSAPAVTLAAPSFQSSLPNAGVLTFRLAPVGQRVVYQHDQDTFDVLEVYSVPIDGSSAPVKLNTPLPSPASDDVTDFLLTSNAQQAVYRDQQGVHVVPTSGLTSADTLTGPVGDQALSADGRWLVYTQGSRPDLFSLPIDGSSAAVQLSGPYAPAGSFLPGARLMAISPDSSRVVYRANQDLNQAFDLYSIAIDGSGPSVNLSGVGGGGLRLQTLEIGPDSACVVYRADPDNDGKFTLFRAPLDGSVPALALSAGPPGTAVESFRISPDGTRVAYVAHVGYADSLYAVPSAGGTLPTLLAGPLVAYGDVHSLEITPDGLHVVYRADQAQDDVIELFAVAIDGSAGPLALHPPLVPGGDVIEQHLSPDGSCVVFLADAATDEVFELFRARITAPGIPLRLNAALPPNGDVTPGFSIRAGSLRVVYRADQEQNNVHELFEVPLNASLPPSKLNAPLVTGGDVLGDFQVSPDGKRVLYRADQERDEVYELFMAFDATSPGRRVSGALVTNGDVLSFQVGPDGRRVFYLADQASDEVVELFACGLPPRSFRRAP